MLKTNILFLIVNISYIYRYFKLNNKMVKFAELTLIVCPILTFIIASHFFGDLIVTQTMLVTPIFSALIFTWQMFAYTLAYNQFAQSKKLPLEKSSIVMKLALVCFVSVFSHVLAVLMGAPLTEQIFETFVWSVLVSALISPSILCLLEPDTDTWLRVILCGLHKDQPCQRLVFFQTYGLAIGAWASCFTIPLDWDRPWQQWPIPLIFGSMIGFCAGSVLNCVVNLKERKVAKIYWFKQKYKDLILNILIK